MRQYLREHKEWKLQTLRSQYVYLADLIQKCTQPTLQNFGTPEQRNTPLEQFLQPDDTEVNATVAMVERMQKHVSISLKKLSGEISIRKQSETELGCDPTKSKIKKASRIKSPERKLSKQNAR